MPRRQPLVNRSQRLHACATETFEPVPSSGALRELQCNLPLEKLAAAAACAAGANRATGAMAGAMRDRWHRQHRVLSHEEQPPCPSLPESVFPLTDCYDLQVCVCEQASANNQQIPLFKQRFQTALARIFSGTKKAPSPALLLLRQGRVVLQLARQQEEDWADDALSALMEDDSQPKQVPAELFFHVGRCNFNTFSCSVLPLTLVKNPNENGFLELEADTGRQAAMVAQTIPQLAAESMNLSDAYALTVYEVVADSETVLSEERVRGFIVEVKANPLVETQLVWKGAGHETRAAAPKRAARPKQQAGRAGGRRRRAVRQASLAAPPAERDEYDADAEGGAQAEHHEDDLLVDGEGDLEEFPDESGDIWPHDQCDKEGDPDQDLFDPGVVGGIGSLSSDGEHSNICASVHSSSDGNANAKDDVVDCQDSSGSSSSSSMSSSSSSVSVSSLYEFAREGEEEEDMEADDEVVDDAVPNPVVREPASQRASVVARRIPTAQDHFAVPGVGQLRYSPIDGYLRAFCARHTNCQRQRTCKSSDRKVQQGRPIGALIAWMRCGADFGTRDEHQRAQPSHEARCSARELFKTLPDWNTWAEYECPRRASEPEEPVQAP